MEDLLCISDVGSSESCCAFSLLSVDPPPVVFPAAVRVSLRQRTQSRRQAIHFDNITPRSKAREAKRLRAPITELHRAKFWCELAKDETKWETCAEDTLTIVRLAALIQKRSGELRTRGQAFIETQERISAKTMAAAAEMYRWSARCR